MSTVWKEESILNWNIQVEDDIPEQRNHHDCGVFMLQYAKCIATNASFKFSEEDMPCIRKQMLKELRSGALDREVRSEKKNVISPIGNLKKDNVITLNTANSATTVEFDWDPCEVLVDVPLGISEHHEQPVDEEYAKNMSSYLSIIK